MDDDSDSCGMLKGSCSASSPPDPLSGNISVVALVSMPTGSFTAPGMSNRTRRFGALGQVPVYEE